MIDPIRMEELLRHLSEIKHGRMDTRGMLSEYVHQLEIPCDAGSVADIGRTGHG